MQRGRQKSSNAVQAIFHKTKPPQINLTRTTENLKPANWKYVYEMLLNNQNMVSELKEECVHIKYNVSTWTMPTWANDNRLVHQIKSVDLLSKLFADADCKLIIDDNPVQVYGSKITLRRGEMFVPINAHVTKPSKAIFFTVERNQDLQLEYLNRCQELKAAMISSFYSKFENAISKTADCKVKKLYKDSVDAAAAAVGVRSGLNTAAIGDNAPTAVVNKKNCFKIISANRIFMPQSNVANSQALLSSTITPVGGGPTLVKLRVGL